MTAGCLSTKDCDIFAAGGWIFQVAASLMWFHWILKSYIFNISNKNKLYVSSVWIAVHEAEPLVSKIKQVIPIKINLSRHGRACKLKAEHPLLQGDLDLGPLCFRATMRTTTPQYCPKKVIIWVSIVWVKWVLPNIELVSQLPAAGCSQDSQHTANQYGC